MNMIRVFFFFIFKIKTAMQTNTYTSEGKLVAIQLVERFWGFLDNSKLAPVCIATGWGVGRVWHEVLVAGFVVDFGAVWIVELIPLKAFVTVEVVITSFLLVTEYVEVLIVSGQSRGATEKSISAEKQ